MFDWILLWLELIKTVLICGLLMTLGFAVLVFIFDVIVVAISAIYEVIRGEK